MLERDGMVYLDYDQAGLDAQYNNRARFPDFAQQFSAWDGWSAQTRTAITRAALDVPFGPSPSERLDVFPADEMNAPVYVFIHGGYWYSLDKSEHSFVADGMKPHGCMTVVMNYGLAPQYDMDEIVRQNRAALAWIWQHAAEYGGDPSRIYVAGHSAGGHLAAMLLATDWSAFAPGLPENLVKGACSISGLFDLEPLRHVRFLADKLRLTPEQVVRCSPILQQYRTAAPLLLVVGGDESDEFQRQSRAMYAVWSELSYPAALVVADARDHFDILNPLREPESDLVRLQLDQMREAFT